MRPFRRAVALAAAAAGVAVVTLTVPTTATATTPAADDPPVTTVVIDDLTPLVPGPKATLRITGRVLNTSDQSLEDVSVTLRRSPAPLTARRDVAAVVALDASATSSSTPSSTPSSTASTDASPAPSTEPADVALTGTTVTVAPTLGPGDVAEFTVSVGFAAGGFSAPGVYVVGAEATGRVGGGASSRVGIARSFVPWFPDPRAVTPARMVWLWPLAAQPAQTATGLLLDDAIPDEVAPGGRLDRLVSLGERAQDTVSWVADPALLSVVADLVDGYEVVVDGEPTLGESGAAARRWLNALAAATSTAGVRTLPYADIDASAAVRAGLSTDVVRAVTTGPAVAATALGHAARGGLYWAPFGRLDPATTDVLASAGVTAIVLSSTAMPPTDGTAPAQATAPLATSAGTVRAVLADRGLTDVLALPQRTASDVVAARQRFLAETALIAQASTPRADGEDATDATPASIVVAPPDLLWDPAPDLVAPLLRAARTAPWLEATGLEDILAAPAPTTSRDRRGYGSRARDAELGPAYMAAVGHLSDRLASFSSILANPTGLTEPFASAILRTQSASWRGDESSGRDLVTAVGSELADQVGKVRVLSEGTVTLSGDTGRIPITIANDLDRPVTVGLRLDADPPVRLSATPLTGITVEPGRIASVDVDVRVIGSDPLSVAIQLTDGKGGDYGRPAMIEVASTAYARAAAWVVAIAFAAIAVFVVVGVVRRIHKARSSSGSDVGA